jgi:hypothetical protein
MDERLDGVVSLSSESVSVEERMLKGDLVREMVARKERGEGIKRRARWRCQLTRARLVTTYPVHRLVQVTPTDAV